MKAVSVKIHYDSSAKCTFII